MKKMILAICTVLLCIALGLLMVFNRASESKQIEANKEARETLSDTELVRPESSREEISESVVSDGQTGADQTDASQTETTGEDAKSQTGENLAVQESTKITVSIRGDSFIKEDKLDQDGVGAAFKELCEEKNQEADIQDYTLYHSGSMTQLRLAGVSEETIEGYQKEHKDNRNKRKLSIYETKVRSAENMDLTRKDQNAIPVLFMGYWGGWYFDIDELIEQQKEILATYDQQEQYIIVGYYPDSAMKIDKKEYKEKMEDAWGEHYIQLDDVLTHAVSEAAGSKDIAAAIYEKMEALGYITKKE